MVDEYTSFQKNLFVYYVSVFGDQMGKQHVTPLGAVIFPASHFSVYRSSFHILINRIGISGGQLLHWAPNVVSLTFNWCISAKGI